MVVLQNMKFAFFGTPEIAALVLDELALAELIPSLIVTNPDAPIGRKQVLTPPPAKVWANAHDVPVFQPSTLRDPALLSPLTEFEWDLFVVVAYGKFIPEWLLQVPKHKTINLHPSLLPKLRGASPIRSAILEDMRETGVTVMLLDAELDHGPILAQLPAQINKNNWPLPGRALDQELAFIGGKLLAESIPRWMSGSITPVEQNHALATFCTKIDKSMSELNIDPFNLPTGDIAYQTFLKICAFDGWPETFFIHESKRIKIKAAHLDETGTLRITRIVPEGKKEMDWLQYFQATL